MGYTAALLIALLATWFVIFAPVPASSATVPLDSWVYPALDKLSALGVLETPLQGIRPLSRREIARQLGGGASQNDLPAAADLLLATLRTEFRPELDRTTADDRHFTPIDTLEAGYRLAAGLLPGPGDRPSFLANRDGTFQHHRHRLWLSFAGDGARGRFSGEWRPLFFTDEAATLQSGRVALSAGSWELSLGRQSLWWGQGRHGTLLLSNNARPLDMVRLTTPSPVSLPGLFRVVGPVRFDLFISRLEKARVVPEPYLAGMRLTVMPTDYLELGAARTIIFGGRGQPHVGVNDFLEILAGENNAPGEADTSNQLAMLDARLTLPGPLKAQLYGEYGGEDEAGMFPIKTAWLAGLHLPAIAAGGRLSLRVEYADLSLQTARTRWYSHSLYRSGYTHRGSVLGHQIGGDGRDLSLDGEYLHSPTYTTSFGIDRETRGLAQPRAEERMSPYLGGRWQVDASLAVSALAALEVVRHPNGTAGEREQITFISTTIHKSF